MQNDECRMMNEDQGRRGRLSSILHSSFCIRSDEGTTVADPGSTHDAQRAADDLLARLRAGGVVYCPIRHHSPACAWHVRRAVLDLRPAAVLVEGPADLTPLVPLILDPAARTPFAAYVTYADKAGRLAAAAAGP